MTQEHGDVIAQTQLEEFKALRAEIVQRLGHQAALVSYALVAGGALLGAIAAQPSLLEKTTSVTLLLLVPWAFALLAWTFQQESQNIADIGYYINRELRPALSKQLGVEAERLLGWENFHHGTKKGLMETVIGYSQYWLLLGLTVAVTALVPYATFSTCNGKHWQLFHWGLLIFNVLIGSALLGHSVWVIRRYHSIADT